MGDRSAIEWTEATWNPATGCTKVSPGCDHCYAETIAHRFAGTKAYPDGFAPTLRPERLDQPLRWRRPRRIFVCSMADLFHDAVSDDYIAEVFGVMTLARQHTFQVLTKRHGRMHSLLNSPPFVGRVAHAANVRDGRTGPPYALPGWPLPNVWVGVSAENQQWANIRIPALIDTPAAVRWVSAEPLLGPIDLLGDSERPGPAIIRQGVRNRTDYGTGFEYDYFDESAIDWVVVGGESGHGARPMHPDWARSLRDQCEAAGIAYLFKQHGEWAPIGPLYGDSDEVDEAHMEAVHLEVNERRQVIQMERSGEIVEPEEYQPTDPRTWLMARVGKKAAGRELDGRLHDGYPS